MFSMPANPGVVGYARVQRDGSTPNINSGLTITRLAIGEYQIVYPGDPTNQEPQQEGQKVAHQDLIFLTGLLTPTAVGVVVDEPNDYTRIVLFTNNSGQATDTEFNVLILRSTLSAPLDANGNQIAPV